MSQATTRKKDSSSPDRSPTSNLSPPTSNISLSHHQRRCSVCGHPNRAAIDDEFLRWRSPEQIAFDHKISDRSCIYRHAHALGLFALRKRNLRWVLENILERVEEVEVTADSIIRAVRAFTRVTDDGQWLEPPTRILVSHAAPPEDSAAFVHTGGIQTQKHIALPEPELADGAEVAAVGDEPAGSLSGTERI